MVLFKLFLGIVMLTMGRRLFWLFLGGFGFVFGFDLAERMIHGQPHSVLLALALISGVIGAILAIFFQKLAVLLAGFFAGSYLLLGLLQKLGIGTAHYHWAFFLIGGIAGAVLMKMVFGWTLIILSSIMGSSLILQTLHLDPQVTTLFFILLTVLGIAVQYGLLKRRPPSHEREG